MARQDGSAARSGWAAMVFGVPWLLHFDYILNLFYYYGAPYYDAGLFAHLLWHNDWALTNPPLRGGYTYFCVHFSPFLLLINRLSYAVPVLMVSFYAGFIATIYALLGLAMFFILSDALQPRRHWQLAVLALLSIGFAFNGVIIKGIWMPHFEYAIPLGIILFLWFYKRGQLGLGLFFFALTLMMREDAGLHLTTVLGPLAVIDFRRHRSWRAIRMETMLAGYALLYSLLAFEVVGQVCENAHVPTGMVFTTIYTGREPYSHLSWDLLAARLEHISVTHIHLWLAFLVTLAWAAWRRDLYLAVGFAAFIPWFFANWTAKNDNTGYIYAYYGFPFVIGFAWPVLAALWRHGTQPTRTVMREAVLCQAVLIAIGLVAWDEGRQVPVFGPAWVWGGYELKPAAVNHALSDAFLAKFDSGGGDLGIVTADAGAAGLIAGKYKGREVPILGERPADTLLYINPSRSHTFSREVIEQQSRNHWEHHYCVMGSALCLLTHRMQEQLGPLAESLSAQPLPPVIDENLLPDR